MDNHGTPAPAAVQAPNINSNNSNNINISNNSNAANACQIEQASALANHNHKQALLGKSVLDNIESNKSFAAELRPAVQARALAKHNHNHKQALLSKSVLESHKSSFAELRPAVPNKQHQRTSTSSNKQVLMLTNEPTEKRRVRRQTRLELSDLELPALQHHRVPKQPAHDDTAAETCCQQTVVATDSASSVLEKDLREKIRRTKKLIKIAQRNTELQHEMTNRLARENEARCTQLDLLPKQTVEEAQLTVACARVRQQLVDTDQTIAALHSRRERAEAKADVLAEQVRVAKSASYKENHQHYQGQG
jgi:hypothetical protein